MSEKESAPWQAAQNSLEKQAASEALLGEELARLLTLHSPEKWDEKWLKRTDSSLYWRLTANIGHPLTIDDVKRVAQSLPTAWQNKLTHNFSRDPVIHKIKNPIRAAEPSPTQKHTDAEMPGATSEPIASAEKPQGLKKPKKDVTVRERVLTQTMAQDRNFLLGYIAKHIDRFGRQKGDRSEHEDILQELFAQLNIATNLSELRARMDDESDRRVWLSQELNKIIREHRRNKARSIRTTNVDISPTAASPSTYSDPILNERLTAVWTALTDTEREVWKLAVTGKDEAEIAEELRVAPTRIIADLAHIRELIHEEVDETELELRLAPPLDEEIKRLLAEDRFPLPSISDEALHSLITETKLNLPPNYQRVLRLYYAEKLTTDDIAAELSMHKLPVRNLLRKAINQLVSGVSKKIKALPSS